MSSRNGTLSDDAKTPAITSITVAGLKSIGTRQTVEVRPLTLLAGANSSGKSSLMQGLLLLKQTLEVQYDPGALLINGANVKFTHVSQLLSRMKDGAEAALSIGFEVSNGSSLDLTYAQGNESGLEVQRSKISTLGRQSILSPDLTDEQIVAQTGFHDENLQIAPLGNSITEKHGRIIRERCFLQPIIDLRFKFGETGLFPFYTLEINIFTQLIRDIIHLPGWRGNAARTYPRTTSLPFYPGTFENYTASIIAHWSVTDDKRLNQVSENLHRLGLTWKVEANRRDDTSVEIRVARLPKPSADGNFDLVNIADVGFGVSQTLPVVVALLVAREGQLVYIEQPEIHLHPSRPGRYGPASRRRCQSRCSARH